MKKWMILSLATVFAVGILAGCQQAEGDTSGTGTGVGTDKKPEGGTVGDPKSEGAETPKDGGAAPTEGGTAPTDGGTAPGGETKTPEGGAGAGETKTEGGH